jgi:hypothetical protein
VEALERMLPIRLELVDELVVCSLRAPPSFVSACSQAAFRLSRRLALHPLDLLELRWFLVPTRSSPLSF